MTQFWMKEQYSHQCTLSIDGWMGGQKKHFFILDRSVGTLLAGKYVSRDGVKKNWVTKSAQSVVDTVETMLNMTEF